MTCSLRPVMSGISLRRFVLCVLSLSLFLFGFTRDASAQTELASLSGTIVDRSGAVVPDAQVRVTNEDTNVTVETKTNGAGVYNLPSLKPGRYRILVTK